MKKLIAKKILEQVDDIVKSRGKTLIEVDKTFFYAKALTKWICAGNYYRNLMITGGVGTGKTTLLTALHRVLNAIKVGSSALVHASVTTHEQFLLSNSWERVHTVPFLCIDDIGTEPQNVKIYGSDKTPIKSIIEDRYATLNPTIITTNHSIKELGALYGDRVEDRLHEYDTMIIDFGSFRQRKD